MSNQTIHSSKLSHFFSLIKRSIRGDEHDYTQGSIRIAIVLLAIPMILELSLKVFFAVVDIFFVSSLGSKATQTVGLTESVITIVYSLAIGLSTAATAMVARRIGEKDPEQHAHAGACRHLIHAIINHQLLACRGCFCAEILQIMGASPISRKRWYCFYPHHARRKFVHHSFISYQWNISWSRRCCNGHA
jgi:Na+-driven multidrug efflux pump